MVIPTGPTTTSGQKKYSSRPRICKCYGKDNDNDTTALSDVVSINHINYKTVKLRMTF